MDADRAGRSSVRLGLEVAEVGSGQCCTSHRVFRITHTHVRARADKGVGDRVDELSRNAEIAQLDVARGVHEDVGGFYV